MVELLTLRRRTNVDELVDSVPRPESGVPTYALPGWKDVSLDLKLPMLKCPNNQIIFSRAKVGQKVRKINNKLLCILWQGFYTLLFEKFPFY